MKPDPESDPNLESLPPEIRELLTQAAVDPQQITLIAQAIKLTTYRGNLIPPEMVAEYEVALPGSGRMFLDVFRERSDLQNEIDRNQSQASIWRAYIGQGFSVIVALVCIAGAVYLVDSHPGSRVVAIFAGALASLGIGGPSVARLLSGYLRDAMKSAGRQDGK